MAAITHEKHIDFHWTAASLALSVIFGLAATLGVWLLTGLMILLFML